MLKDRGFTNAALAAICAVSFSACGLLNMSIASNNGGAGIKTCTLDGTWSACIVAGANSQQQVMTISGTSFSEVAYDFTGVTDCSGSGSLSASIHTDLAHSAFGVSTRAAGATDLVFTPTGGQDLFGCGANQPGYSFLLLADDCQSFNPSNAAPGCTTSSGPTAIDFSNVFRRI